MWLLKASGSVSFRVYGSMELTSPSLAQRRVWACAERAVPQSRAAARASRRIVGVVSGEPGFNFGGTLGESAAPRKGKVAGTVRPRHEISPQRRVRAWP